MIAIVLIVAALFLALVLAQRAQSRMPASELDLSSVRNAMIEKHGWTAERAERAQTEYVRFLTLLQMKPGFMLVPWKDAEGHDDLDQFWHQHILDTAKYAADCKSLFGRMIHHNPHVLRGSEQEKEAVDKTRRLYARTFDSGVYGSVADQADSSGCAACATTPVNSGGAHSSHSGHDAGSGGHGGHGDGGGHGCGGHGCGHGCGGH